MTSASPAITLRRLENDVIPYEVVRTLGSGNYGTVFLVKHRGDDKLYAMKEFRMDLGRKPRGTWIKRIEDEIAAHEALSRHPQCNENIVCIREAFYRGEMEVFYLVMDYVEDATETIVQKPREVVDAFGQAVAALKFIHDSGILHRDISPNNILYDGRHVKFLDFGFACFRAACKGSPGTVGYRDPYCLMHNTDIRDPTSDVYSLAATFFRLYYGVPYFTFVPTREDYKENYEMFGAFDEVKAGLVVPTLLYEMMNPFHPEDRPTLEGVLVRLREAKKKSKPKSLLSRSVKTLKSYVKKTGKRTQ